MGTTNTDGWAGECTSIFTLEDGDTKSWISPNYDGTTNYPEGEYCCWLNVTIPASYDMFMAVCEMSSPSNIHETRGCTGDTITYYSSAGTSSTLCGDIAGQVWTETSVFAGVSTTFQFKWCSVRDDGGTNVGFNMTITGQDLMPGGR